MSNFDFKKYLVENKLTSNSRMLNEGINDISDAAVNLLMDKSKYMTKPGSSKGVYVVYDLSLPKGKGSFGDDNSTQKVGYWWTKDSVYKGNKFESDDEDTIKKLLALNEEEGTDILSFLKSNKQELLSKLTEKFKYDEDDMEMMSKYEIGPGADADGNEDAEIAGLGEAGLDFSFNPKKVKDTYGDAFNFKLVIAGKPIYGISYNM